jgi:hypothetical protein
MAEAYVMEAPPRRPPVGATVRVARSRPPVSGKAGPAPPSVRAAAPSEPAAAAPLSGQTSCGAQDLDCNGLHIGKGAFAKPPQFWVGKADDLRFAVGLTDVAIARELAPGDTPTPSAPVNLGRCMRVTLEKSARFDIVSANGETRRLARDMGRASWSWTILPKQAGRAEARALVEVLQAADGRCTSEAVDQYTEAVSMNFTIGRWRSFLDAVGSASNAGEVFSALFKSWEGALVSLTALVTAIGGLFLAIRKLGPKGRERRAARRERSASAKAERQARRRPRK